MGLALPALTALVVGSMIGSGIFALPSQMAGSAAAGPLLIGWAITGVGMLMLAFVFQSLAQRKPEVDGGVYGYAREGFGEYVGFTSAWGYWISAWVGNVGLPGAAHVDPGLLVPRRSRAAPPWLPIVGASLLLWVVHALTLSGVRNAAFVNVVVTIAKVVPILTFIAIAAVGFSAGLFTTDIWGVDAGLGGTMDQVKNMMLVTVWVFIGIEGAAVYSQRARSRKDVGRATVLGFVGVLGLLLAVNLLSYGLMAQADIAGLSDPSMAGLLENEVGEMGCRVHLRRAWSSRCWGPCSPGCCSPSRSCGSRRWTTCFPRRWRRRTGTVLRPRALWLTNVCVQAMLLWTLVNENTYTDLVYLATSLILLPYLWSAAYQLKLAVAGETYDGRATADARPRRRRAEPRLRRVAGLRRRLAVRPHRRAVLPGRHGAVRLGPQGERPARLRRRSRRLLVGVVARCPSWRSIGLVQGFVSV